jgi:hypothetical protein
MLKGNLTKDQAISIVGQNAVDAVERENCEPTNRVGYNGACQNNDLCEWSAGVSCKTKDGNDRILLAYYYTTNEQDDLIAETGDAGSIDWIIEGYEIE